MPPTTRSAARAQSQQDSDHSSGQQHQQHRHNHHGHHEHHGHHGHDHDSMTFTEKNRSHWNQHASKYTEQQWQKEFVNKINEFILSKVNWLGVDFLDPATQFEKSGDSSKQIRVLDYACGPGTVTSALEGRATEYVGIDLSENMVKAYNKRFSSESGSESINAHAVVGNLLEDSGTPDSLSGSEFFEFDLAAIGLGFHHFENVQLATNRLVERLKAGGVFMIIDFAPHAPERVEDNSNNQGAADHARRVVHTVAHHGFSEEMVKEVFEAAGLVDVEIVHMEEDLMMRGTSRRKAFMAKGRKP